MSTDRSANGAPLTVVGSVSAMARVIAPRMPPQPITSR
jgi:hypothetical protein